MFGLDKLIFIRPDTNDKVFHGGLAEVDDDIQAKTCETLDLEQMIVIGEPINVLKEFRFVCIDGKIVTGSEYTTHYDTLIQTELKSIYDKEWVFAQRVANSYRLDTAFVIDIARVRGGDLKLVEYGSINCAGFYKCNKEIIVDEIQKLLKKTEDLSKEYYDNMSKKSNKAVI